LVKELFLVSVTLVPEKCSGASHLILLTDPPNSNVPHISATVQEHRDMSSSPGKRDAQERNEENRKEGNEESGRHKEQEGKEVRCWYAPIRPVLPYSKTYESVGNVVCDV
jgi:hypothetical protein